MKSTTELWKQWEGQWVDGKFPLRVWLDGSDHSAVFLTELRSQPSQKAAIKLIPAESSDSERRFTNWRRAAQLSHPHLLRVLAMGRCQIESTPLLYVVMEHADEDLSQILPHRPLTPVEAGELLPPVLEALSYLHEKGLVHGHLQPSNIFAVKNEVKLSSDRISSFGEAADKTQSPTAYDAPEMAPEPLSAAADIWSLGMTLVEALTQQLPAYKKTQSNDPDIPASVPEPFRGVAGECLRWEPRRRPTIAVIKARLQSGSASAPPTFPAQSEKKNAGSRIVANVAALIVLAFFGWWVFSRIVPAKSSARGEQIAASQPQPSAKLSDKPAKAAKSAGEVALQVLPDVPRSARNTIQGKIRVTVRLHVDSSGKVSNATLTSPGPSKYFANLALRAAQRWEFIPPVVDGRAVPSAWLLRFRFGRAAIEVSPVRANP